jgi:uncharacterized RDD family membrane protein YckC
MSSAQRDLLPLDDAANETEAAQPFALKEQVAQRLAAHRARRGTDSTAPVTPIAKPSNTRSARIAAAVAERYAQSQSYRAFLAAQAEAAIREAEAAAREAEAAAEVAALSAQAIADAQYQLLAELDQWSLTPPEPLPQPTLVERPAPKPTLTLPQAVAHPSPASLTVRLYEDVAHKLPPARPAPLTTHPVPPAHISNRFNGSFDESETIALDEEIAFRQSPVFEESTPPVDIPANLLEFPRQLVAARRARPRLAEGPLREEASQTPQTAQLRIFEVEPAQISTAPVVESVEPEWSSILLAAHPVTAPVETPEAPFIPLLSPQTAPIGLRLMAAIVDGCIVLASLLLFAAAFALTFAGLGSHTAAASSHPQITLQIAAIAAAVTLAVLTLLYQLLFFTFSDATPGMRYARIGLCTFSDDNPTRAAMLRRIFAVLLSACPLGIGFLWACMDEDGLGWHDRISRIYQRSY